MAGKYVLYIYSQSIVRYHCRIIYQTKEYAQRIGIPCSSELDILEPHSCREVLMLFTSVPPPHTSFLRLDFLSKNRLKRRVEGFLIIKAGQQKQWSDEAIRWSITRFIASTSLPALNAVASLTAPRRARRRRELRPLIISPTKATLARQLFKFFCQID
jgi:hypothetical protein